jgi:hypothetical protein
MPKIITALGHKPKPKAATPSTTAAIPRPAVLAAAEQVKPVGPFNTVVAGAAGSGRLLDITADELARLKPGQWVWTQSVRDFWAWQPGSTATANTQDILTPTVIGAGAGRFFRQFYPDPTWKQQRQWVVRPSTGNFENTGADDANPLDGDAELGRRLGFTAGLRPEFPPGDYHFYFPEGVGIAAGPNARAYFAGRRSVTNIGSAFAFNTVFYVHGNTPTTIGQGTPFAGPYTISAVTPANHATNTPLQIASAGIATSWTAAALISTPGTNTNPKRCRMTTGANAGGTFWAKEDLGNLLGGNPTAMCDEPDIQQTYTGAFTLATGTFTPQVGDQFVVETLPTIGSTVLDTDGQLQVIFESVSFNVTEAHASFITVSKCQVVHLTQQSFLGIPGLVRAGGCRFSSNTSTRDTWWVCQNLDIFNCNFDGTVNLRVLGQGNVTRAFIHGTSSSVMLSSSSHARPSTSSTRTEGWLVNSVGIINVPNTLGLVIADSVQFSSTCEIWGKGNAFTPIMLLANSRLYWTAGNVHGGAPPASFFYIDLTGVTPAGTWVACDDLNNTSIPAWDDTANAFTASRTLTPAHLQASIAGGGFNGRFFDPVSGCSMVATQQG